MIFEVTLPSKHKKIEVHFQRISFYFSLDCDFLSPENDLSDLIL